MQGAGPATIGPQRTAGWGRVFTRVSSRSVVSSGWPPFMRKTWGKLQRAPRAFISGEALAELCLSRGNTSTLLSSRSRTALSRPRNEKERKLKALGLRLSEPPAQGTGDAQGACLVSWAARCHSEVTLPAEGTRAHSHSPHLRTEMINQRCSGEFEAATSCTWCSHFTFSRNR